MDSASPEVMPPPRAVVTQWLVRVAVPKPGPCLDLGNSPGPAQLQSSRWDRSCLWWSWAETPEWDPEEGGSLNKRAGFIKNSPSCFSINQALTLPPGALETPLFPSGAGNCVALGKPLFSEPQLPHPSNLVAARNGGPRCFCTRSLGFKYVKDTCPPPARRDPSEAWNRLGEVERAPRVSGCEAGPARYGLCLPDAPAGLGPGSYRAGSSRGRRSGLCPSSGTQPGRPWAGEGD